MSTEGERLRDEGTAKAYANSPDEFRRLFRMAFREFLAKKKPFTCDDVRARCVVLPHHPNAIGANFRALVKQYDLEQIAWKKGENTKSHAAHVGIWAHPSWAPLTRADYFVKKLREAVAYWDRNDMEDLASWGRRVLKGAPRE